jgi:hypothetical protein
VHSFDYDPQSVACTHKLKEDFFSGDMCWIVEEGSVLDNTYLSKLGKFNAYPKSACELISRYGMLFKGGYHAISPHEIL